MRIDELADAIEARVIVPGRSDGVITSVYGGMTMSDLIANAGPGTLLVTSLNNAQLMRLADLMDVPGICLVDGCIPAAELLPHAEQSRTALLVSPFNLMDTCTRASDCLKAGRRAS